MNPHLYGVADDLMQHLFAAPPARRVANPRPTVSPRSCPVTLNTGGTMTTATSVPLETLFTNDVEAEMWAFERRFIDGTFRCTKCRSAQQSAPAPSEVLKYGAGVRCGNCKAFQSARVGTIMEGHRSPLRVWIQGARLFLGNPFIEEGEFATTLRDRGSRSILTALRTAATSRPRTHHGAPNETDIAVLLGLTKLGA